MRGGGGKRGRKEMNESRFRNEAAEEENNPINQKERREKASEGRHRVWEEDQGPMKVRHFGYCKR